MVQLFNIKRKVSHTTSIIVKKMLTLITLGLLITIHGMRFNLILVKQQFAISELI